MTDFDDEDAVLAEVAKVIDIDPDDLKIKQRGNTYEVTLRGAKYGKSWTVMESEDEAEAAAIEQVKDNLSSDPEIFSTDLLASHINEDRLRRDLYSDVQNSNYELVNDMKTDEFWDTADRYGMDVPDEDEDGERPDPNDNEIETLADKMTDEQLEDPVEYLQEIYGKEDGIKKAIEIGGIDEDAVAEEVIRYDGWAHILSSYNGDYETTKSRFVVWRDN